MQKIQEGSVQYIFEGGVFRLEERNFSGRDIVAVVGSEIERTGCDEDSTTKEILGSTKKIRTYIQGMFEVLRGVWSFCKVYKGD